MVKNCSELNKKQCNKRNNHKTNPCEFNNDECIESFDFYIKNNIEKIKKIKIELDYGLPTNIKINRKEFSYNNFDYIGFLNNNMLKFINLEELIIDDLGYPPAETNVSLNPKKRPNSLKKIKLPNDFQENGFNHKLVENLDSVHFYFYPRDLLYKINKKYKLFNTLIVDNVSFVGYENLKDFYNHIELLKTIKFKYDKFSSIVVSENIIIDKDLFKSLLKKNLNFKDFEDFIHSYIFKKYFDFLKKNKSKIEIIKGDKNIKWIIKCKQDIFYITKNMAGKLTETEFLQNNNLLSSPKIKVS